MKPGVATIDAVSPIEAGSWQSIRYTFTARHPIDDTGAIKIAFRFASDAGTPQFEAPAGPNYCSLVTDGNCRIEPRWDPKGHTRPWGKALYLKVMGGYLNAGETITVTFGDRKGGSPGWRVQTFCEKTFEFKTLVDPFATVEFKELEKSPTMAIVAGDPAKAVCIAPSQVVAGKSFNYSLRIEDRWGNAVARAAIHRHPDILSAAIRTIEVRDEASGLIAVSNPIEMRDGSPGLSRWWADYHGQSEETIGSNSIDDYFRYARDAARVDIVAHQGNDFQITDEFWRKINDATEAFYKPGSLVTFPGYEWSGNTPLGGDRNVYHKAEGGEIRRSSHDLLPGHESIYPQAPTAKALFASLCGTDSFAFAHVGGRYADVSMHKEGVEVAMEIHSAWGTFEWFVEEALEAGYRIGICANSDGHKGRPGASYPGASRFGSYGGLTCVLAETLDREHVFDAMHRRHFYATTGNRPLLDVTVVTAKGATAQMGEVIDAGSGASELRVCVAGTAPIDFVEVRNGSDLVKRLRPHRPAHAGRCIKVVWSGAEVKGRDRMVRWDGSLRVRGNRILSIEPINFWNPDEQPEQSGATAVSWASITTGGLAGIIVELDLPSKGRVEISTVQKSCGIDLASVGYAPKTFRAGGLRKQIQVYRLPDPEDQRDSIDFTLSLKKLHSGDNPIYVKVIQQDGHMAWSSPIYVTS